MKQARMNMSDKLFGILEAHRVSSGMRISVFEGENEVKRPLYASVGEMIAGFTIQTLNNYGLLDNLENPEIQTLEQEIRQKQEQLTALKTPAISVDIVDVEPE